MPAQSTPKRNLVNADQAAVRKRILYAALSAFMEGGFAATSTIEIATRAHVSKRDLYALVGNKQEMLSARIRARATRLQISSDLPIPRDRETLAQALIAFGTQLLREVSDPTAVAVFRLAIAEAVCAPEVAQTLDSIGRGTARAALMGMLTQARSAGLLGGRVSDMADKFSGLLWDNLMVSLLLRVTNRPSPREIARRAREAADGFLKLFPQPGDATAKGRTEKPTSWRRRTPTG